HQHALLGDGAHAAQEEGGQHGAHAKLLALRGVLLGPHLGAQVVPLAGFQRVGHADLVQRGAGARHDGGAAGDALQDGLLGGGAVGGVLGAEVARFQLRDELLGDLGGVHRATVGPAAGKRSASKEGSIGYGSISARRYSGSLIPAFSVRERLAGRHVVRSVPWGLPSGLAVRASMVNGSVATMRAVARVAWPTRGRRSCSNATGP